MTISVQNETFDELPFSIQNVAQQVIQKTLEFEKFPYEVEVDLTLVDEASIQEINRDMRQIDSVTDVLSFPLISYEGGGIYHNLMQQDIFNPDTGEAMLGDIVICVPRMKEQAVSYGHSLLREYAFLITHSMLHLLGYDHMEEVEEERMFRKQEQILNLLEITRGKTNETDKED